MFIGILKKKKTMIFLFLILFFSVIVNRQLNLYKSDRSIICDGQIDYYDDGIDEKNLFSIGNE
jgi:hypothetical protein